MDLTLQKIPFKDCTKKNSTIIHHQIKLIKSCSPTKKVHSILLQFLFLLYSVPYFTIFLIFSTSLYFTIIFITNCVIFSSGMYNVHRSVLWEREKKKKQKNRNYLAKQRVFALLQKLKNKTKKRFNII